jgi:hypothetical protein
MTSASMLCCAVLRYVMCRGSDPTALPSRFAWLVGGLLLHGHQLLPQLADDGSVADAAEYVGDMRQLQLGPSNSSPEDEPVSLVRIPRYCHCMKRCYVTSAAGQVFDRCD